MPPRLSSVHMFRIFGMPAYFLMLVQTQLRIRIVYMNTGELGWHIVWHQSGVSTLDGSLSRKKWLTAVRTLTVINKEASEYCLGIRHGLGLTSSAQKMTVCMQARPNPLIHNGHAPHHDKVDSVRQTADIQGRFHVLHKTYCAKDRFVYLPTLFTDRKLFLLFQVFKPIDSLPPPFNYQVHKTQEWATQE